MKMPRFLLENKLKQAQHMPFDLTLIILFLCWIKKNSQDLWSSIFQGGIRNERGQGNLQSKPPFFKGWWKHPVVYMTYMYVINIISKTLCKSRLNVKYELSEVSRLLILEWFYINISFGPCIPHFRVKRTWLKQGVCWLIVNDMSIYIMGIFDIAGME